MIATLTREEWSALIDRDKPRIRRYAGRWACGLIYPENWHMLTPSGRTPQEAYRNWREGCEALYDVYYFSG